MKRTKTKKISKNNRLQTGLILAIVLVVLGTVIFNNYRIRIKSQEYAAKEAELDLQIAEAQAEKEALKEQEEYRKTDAYKEEVAREEFGMIKEGEYILKDSEASE